MLKESGNILTENISITKDLLDFCLAESFFIDLKTGNYSKQKPEATRAKNNETIIQSLGELYLKGDFYYTKYSKIFNRSKESVAGTLKKALKDRFIPATTLYRDEIQTQFQQTMFENHGVFFAQQSPKIREKTKQTNIAQFGVDCNFKAPESKERTKKTLLQKYGVENVMQSKEILAKRDRTNQERYGGRSPLNDPEVKKRAISTQVERYGVENVMQCEEIQQRHINTMTQRYGVKHAIRHPEFEKVIRSKSRDTCLERYGTEYAQQNPEIAAKISDGVKRDRITWDERYRKLQEIKAQYRADEVDKLTVIDWVQANYSNTSSLVFLKDLGIKSAKTSIPELKVREFVQSLLPDDGVLNNKRPHFMQGLELDIWIPSKNVAIEVNGVYWHSTLFKEPGYHQNKKKLALSANLSLMMFTDVQVLDPIKFEIVKSIIKHRLGFTETKIPARKCIVKEIDSKTARLFLEENHLDGSSPAKFNFGLFCEDELVQVCTFSKSRFNRKSGSFELIRSATKLDTVVQGGFSKLINYFKQHHLPEGSILESYVNANIYDAKSYGLVGVILPEMTSPDLWFVWDDVYPRQKFMKHNLHKIFPEFPKRGDPDYEQIKVSEFLEAVGVVEFHGCGNFKCIL